MIAGWWDIIHTTVRNRGAHFKRGTDLDAVAVDVHDKFLQWRRHVGSKDISDKKLIGMIVKLMEQVEDRK